MAMKKQNKLNHRLAYKLLIYTLLFSTIAILLTSSFQVYFEFRDDVESINSGIQIIAESYLPSIASSVFSADDDQVEILLEGILHILHVEFVEISSKDNSIAFSKGDSSLRRDIIKEFPLVYSRKSHEDVHLGSILICASYDGIYQKLFKKAKVTFLVNILYISLISLLVLMIFNSLVIRHLEKISDYIRNTDIENQEIPLSLSQKKGVSNELSLVATSINEMNSTLRQKMNELRKSEETFRLITESSNDFISKIDLQGRFIYVSPSHRHLGYTPQDLLGKSAFDFLHEDEIHEMKELFKNTIENPVSEIDSSEFRFRKANGDFVCLHGNFSFVINSDGVQDSFVMNSRDITQQRLAAKELEKTKARYRTVADFTHDWEYWIKPDKSFEYVSPSCKRITGYSVEEFFAHPLLLDELVVDEDKESWLKHSSENQSNHKESIINDMVQFRISRKDGQIVWIEHVCRLVLTENDEFVGFRVGNRDISLRKNAEAELLQSEKRFRTFFDQAIVGMAITSKEKSWIEVNDIMCKLFGYSREELFQFSWAELTHPDDLALDVNHFDRVLAGEIDSYSIEKRFIRKDGSPFYSEINVSIIRNVEDNSVKHFLLLVNDITQRKTAEAERVAHLHFLKSLSRIDRVIQKDEDMDILLSELMQVTLEIFEADRAWLHLPCDPDAKWWGIPIVQTRTGYSVEVPKSGEPMTAEIQVALRSYLEKGDVGVIDYRDPDTAQDVSKKHSILSEMNMPIFPRLGKPWLFGIHQCSHYQLWSDQQQNLFREIGRRISDALSSMLFLNDLQKSKEILKITNQELSVSEAKYRSMMESMSEPTYICSPDYHIEYMNPAMIKTIGRDATGEICYEALHDTSKVCPWCKFAEVKKGKIVNYDILRKKDNKTYSISNSPISNSDGSISKLAIFRDTTDFKQMESKLQQSQKMESIGTLAGGIAHDFNNMLFPIIGYSSILLDDMPKDSRQHHYISEISTAALRAKELVKQILTFSRQDKTEIMLTRIQTIINEVLRLIRATIPTTIEIESDLDDDCGPIAADPTQMHQIIMNLATNAYHAMEETGGKLLVALKEIELTDTPNSDLPAGEYVLLTISDTGIGMSEAVLEKIFEPFFTTKETGKGTGMGLSVVHGIISKMNGEIKVSSELGKGTTFDVYLPVEAEVFDSFSSDLPVSFQGGNERILIVDDEQSIRTMEKLMLERLGYKITTIENSIEALRIFKENPNDFDLVISDMAMPKMSGADLAQQILLIRPEIPIILCTGYSNRIDEQSAKAIGIREFVVKPVTKDVLTKMIRKVLS